MRNGRTLISQVKLYATHTLHIMLPMQAPRSFPYLTCFVRISVFRSIVPTTVMFSTNLLDPSVGHCVWLCRLDLPTNQALNFENFVGIYCINPTIQTPQDALWGLPTVRINDCTMNLPKRVVIQGVETWFSSSPHSPNILALR